MTFKQFASSMVGGRAFQPMFNADGGNGGASGSGDQNPDGGQAAGGDGGDPDQGGAGAGAGTTTDDPGKPTFSDEQQEFINNLIGKTIKTERTKAEQERKRLEELANLDETGKLKKQLEERETALADYNKKVMDYEIRDVARELGVPAKKISRFLKVVDRDGIELDGGNVDRIQVEQAVKAVLADMPEFKAPENVRGPGGEGFEGGQPSKAKYTEAQIRAMDPKEIAADYDEVMKSLQVHQKK